MEYNNSNEVTIVDIKMPFWSIVTFMVKATIASIPAIIILYLLGLLFALFFGGIFAGLNSI